VTIALARWKKVDPAIYQVVDRVHLMSYDNGYPHGTRHKSSHDVQTLLTRGCPPHKLILGVPFYGRNRQGEARSYKRLIADRSGVMKDRIDGFAFNSRNTIIAKMAMTRQLQLGGIMIWELGQDTTDPKTSLLSTIASELSHP
jgi:GH18 family chitinase